ncbi:response regulator transcription factor [Nonomuraea sp. PA05]|uniref:response regulator transcription factor n=1 Tax=Nonomuraea sp. PA05 TaxID=2604466 RepID=UPI0016527E4B|nr:response regulator transcription factor [Nonomuraea sp. PA05]
MDSARKPPMVLVVDDEPNIRELLLDALELNGFQVRTAASGTQALESVGRERPDIILLDVMLPDLDGFAVAQRLRPDGGGPPVLFLTARDTVADRIAGLSAGGDDYVTKPFSLEEVVLRIRAILRRTGAGREEERDDGLLRYADLELEEETHVVRRGGRRIHLSPTEFGLLRYLMINAERVVSKSQILDRVWSSGFGADSRIVESYISYLRRKIDVAGPPLIHTLRGVGYSLRDQSLLDRRR